MTSRFATSFAKARRIESKRILQEREKLYEEKISKQLAEIESAKHEPYRAAMENEESLPKPQYNNESMHTNSTLKNNGLPFVKPLNEPYPNAPFNEARPESLLIWNDFQERYELRDKRILSEKTKQIMLSMNRRFPHIWTKEQLSKTFSLSKENIDFIFWENEMRIKYKIPYDLDTIKLLEAYCGTKDILESKAYTLLAYSDVTGDPFYSQGKYTQCSPLIVHEDEMDEQLYSWQRKEKHVPKLKTDQFEILPSNGSGSGKQLMNEEKFPRDKEWSYLILDETDSETCMKNNKPINVKVRECNGEMRWGTMEEINYVNLKEYPTRDTPFNRIRKGYGRLYYKKENVFPKRKFPLSPFIDHGYQEHHWLGGGKLVDKAWPRRLTRRPNGRKRAKDPQQKRPIVR